MLRIDFYYWGDQCPHNAINRDKLKAIGKDKGYDILFHDISRDFDLAGELNIYSPNLTVFNREFRWNGPVSLKAIEVFEKGSLPERAPYIIDMSENIVKGDLKPLTEETVFDTYNRCAPSFAKQCCHSKAGWIREVREKNDLKNLGFLHYLNGECVGGAEFVPSVIVPYPIPRDEGTAFLTCAFHSDPRLDYKSYPLEKLEEDLKVLGYKELIAIASEEVVFPNGPLKWFLKQGYADLGQVCYEQTEEARMHLIKKQL